MSKNQVRWIIAYLNDGCMRSDDAMRLLDQDGIHGAVREDGSFIGYDYTNQVWIDTRERGYLASN